MTTGFFVFWCVVLFAHLFFAQSLRRLTYVLCATGAYLHITACVIKSMVGSLSLFWSVTVIVLLLAGDYLVFRGLLMLIGWLEDPEI